MAGDLQCALRPGEPAHAALLASARELESQLLARFAELTVTLSEIETACELTMLGSKS
jgi:hypothetical protein